MAIESRPYWVPIVLFFVLSGVRNVVGVNAMVPFHLVFVVC